MDIKDKKYSVIVVEGEVKEGFVVKEDMFKMMFVGDILTIGVGNYDKEKDMVGTNTMILGKYDLLTRQHLTMGTMIHKQFLKNRKEKEKEK